MKCPSCGFENEEGSKFCQSCGGNLAEVGAPPPREAPPPPPSGGAPPPPRPGPAPKGEIDLGGWISRGFSEVFSDIGNYIIMGLVVGIGSGITAGILAGPLYAGALSVTRKKLRGEGTIDVGSVFSIGFEKFLPTFLLVFIPAIVMAIVAIIPVVGGLIDAVAVGFLLPLWALAFHYVMEENDDFMPAAKKAWDIIAGNIGMFWVFGFVTSIITGIGGIVCGVGVFVTIPVGIVILSLLTESYFPKR